MSFLNPLMLLALAAASIPLLLHLLNLRRSRMVEFSSVRFLRELQRSKLRSLRLQQIFLLLLRLGVVIFSVLSFSGPVIGTSAVTREERPVVIILDNSWSNRYLSTAEDGMEGWRRSGLEALSALNDGDRYAIIPLSGGTAGGSKRLRREKEWGIEYVSALQSGFGRPGYASALREAADLLQRESAAGHIVLCTDLQDMNFKDLERSGLILPEGTSLGLVDLSDGGPPENSVSIDSIEVRVPVGSGGLMEVSAYLMNRSRKESRSVRLSLRIGEGGAGDMEEVDLASGEGRRLELRGSPDRARGVSGSVDLIGDEIDEDNRRWFALDVAGRRSVSVIAEGGSQRTIQRVLGLVPSISATYLPDAPVSGGAGSDRLSDAGVLVMVDPAHLDARSAAEVGDFVRGGGGLLLFAGDNLAASGESSPVLRALGLFPHEVVTAGSLETPFHITTLQQGHPLFDGVFDQSTGGRVPSPAITRVLPVNDGQPVVVLDNGFPLVSDISLGGGRVVWVALPPDGSWSDISTSSLMLPLLLQSIDYLGRGSSPGRGYVVGDSPLISLTPGRDYPSKGELSLPDGNLKSVAILTSGRGSSIAPGVLTETGIYEVLADGEPIVRFAVNGAAAESELRTRSVDEALAALRGVAASPELVNEGRGIGDADGGGIGLWQILLLLALACAVVEMIVGRGGRGQSGRQ